MLLGATTSALLLSVAGVLAPCYSSFKTLRAKHASKHGTVNDWTIYWIIFAIFRALEVPADVFLCWVPFYYDFKVAFVVWLWIPYSRGAQVLYTGTVEPWLRKQQPALDEYGSRVLGAFESASWREMVGEVAPLMRGMRASLAATLSASPRARHPKPPADHTGVPVRSAPMKGAPMKGAPMKGDHMSVPMMSVPEHADHSDLLMSHSKSVSHVSSSASSLDATGTTTAPELSPASKAFAAADALASPELQGF
jgi:hypothetical protein|tara:strand:- start:67 stop:822 length:756 start_codon:yes stop_codon:yes gene_type:complete